MKASELPTKIYFTILDIGSGYVYNPSLDDNGGTEYIRKDALLEWAKEKQRQMKIEAGGCSNTLAAGKYLAYKEIIDEIESI